MLNKLVKEKQAKFAEVDANNRKLKEEYILTKE